MNDCKKFSTTPLKRIALKCANTAGQKLARSERLTTYKAMKINILNAYKKNSHYAFMKTSIKTRIVLVKDQLDQRDYI